MQTVDRVVNILHAVSSAADGLTLTEVAREVGLAPATTHRLLTSLSAAGMVERRDSRRWYGGAGLRELGQAGAAQPPAA
ncbi:MAG: helix-turn-helix domain-containing protein [Solirubrobacteraceae bacterium]|nr:helix-turn-helix domain-containing protein [Solirubrobacteraceae bacterium]